MNSNGHASKFDTFISYLSYLDLFGQKVDLTYNKEIYFRTYYGAVFTIIMLIVLIVKASVGYKELTIRLNPIINMIEVEGEGIKKLDLIGDNITIALGFVEENRSDHVYDRSFFELEAKYIEKSKNESKDLTTIKQIDIVHCEHKNFENFSNIYWNFNLQKALCLKATNLQKLEIYSDPQEFVENYLKIALKFCSENENNNCKSVEQIIEKLTKVTLYLYIVHDYFDVRDLTNPIKRRLSMEKWNFDDLVIRRKDTLYLTSGNLVDYNNFIMSVTEPKTQKFVFYTEKNIRRNFKFADISQDNKILDIYLKTHATPLKIIRKFNTFIDLLATLGGLFNIFFISGSIIIGLIDKNVLDMRMINDHFNIIEKRDIEMTPFKEKSDFHSNFVNSNEIIDKTQNSSRKEDNLIPKSSNRFILNYTIKDIFFYIFCIKNKSLARKNEIYNGCKSLLDDYLDVRKFISMIQEFKIMRSVLFDSIQLSLIENYKKPVFKIDSELDQDILTVYRTSNFVEYLDQIQADENRDILNNFNSFKGIINLKSKNTNEEN